MRQVPCSIPPNSCQINVPQVARHPVLGNRACEFPAVGAAVVGKPHQHAYIGSSRVTGETNWGPIQVGAWSLSAYITLKVFLLHKLRWSIAQCCSHLVLTYTHAHYTVTCCYNMICCLAHCVHCQQVPDRFSSLMAIAAAW